MARRFEKLTKQQMSRLLPGERLTEHGIEYQRLPNGDSIFRVNVMVDGERVHRTLGLASDGVTVQKASEWMGAVRVAAAEGRLHLPKGRKTEKRFAVAAPEYLRELERTGGKDIAE